MAQGLAHNLSLLQQHTHRERPWKKIILGLGALGLAAGGIAVAIVSFRPGAAAQNIDRLRDVIGDAAVAQLETAALSVQDRAQQLKYQAGLEQPAAPWQDSNPAITAGGSPAWHPAPLTPVGKLAGEGQWSPYIQAADGTIVAYRTFLQPDPRRPYSIAAIVAFDLQATRLHFVLGSVEPWPRTPQPSRTGTIPAADLQPGILLATFNGGFKARHGHYGAMADGLIALPPINGLATVAMYQDGRVRIGAWGKDILDSPDLVAWRQNGEMLIANGQINPATNRTDVNWGSTIKGEAITWRSALGLSADGRTLYYAAGPQLNVPTLAKAMAQIGAAQALQLDVNNFWVHFTAIRNDGPNLVAEPLLKGMNEEADRYLKGYSRDFFYVTTITR